jgi:hypothetical protein
MSAYCARLHIESQGHSWFVLSSCIMHQCALLYYFTLSNARWFYLLKVSHEWVKNYSAEWVNCMYITVGSGIRSAFIQCLNCGTNRRWHCPPIEGIWYKYCLYTISVFWQSNRPFGHFLDIWATEIYSPIIILKLRDCKD